MVYQPLSQTSGMKPGLIGNAQRQKDPVRRDRLKTPDRTIRRSNELGCINHNRVPCRESGCGTLQQPLDNPFVNENQQYICCKEERA